MKLIVIILLSGNLLYRPGSGADDKADLSIGSKPPEFEDITWLSGAPLQLLDLRGKVVLIRWWTAPECPFCAASAPALNNLATEFVHKGLVVIGLYHHKSNTPLTTEFVKEQMQQLHLQFPVGIDMGWKNLRRWWLQKGDQDWTSVSFLLDREGVVRYVHPGGAFSIEPLQIFPKAQEDYQTLRSHIIQLLGTTDSIKQR